MKKFTRFMLMMVCMMLMVGLFTGSSCDKSTKSQEDKLIGTWRLVNAVYHTEAGDLTLTPQMWGYTSMTIEIKEDGTVTTTEVDLEGTTTVTNGTWDVDDDQVDIVGGGIDENVQFKVTGDNLKVTFTMYEDMDFDGVDDEMMIDLNFTRIN